MVLNSCLWLNLLYKAISIIGTELINLYPANKMENLLLLLNKISEVSPLGVFNQEVIIVQNAGMQHWLNLAIAKERGISMNIHYALPAQFLWQTIRALASNDKVPEQSPYSREVLTWRIYALLASELVLADDDFSATTNYWLKSEDNTAYSNQANLKRYQLAVQMADLYEQYLIFRPQWLDAWQRGDFSIAAANDNVWQAKLWQHLIGQLPYNPIELLNDAVANIKQKLIDTPLLLPKRLSFFGINSMAPMWLSFINALSEHIEVDFFHLNPCFSYWGDLISEKQAMKRLSHWSEHVADEHLFVGNPLLANLGQQGREFLALLQDVSTINVEIFIKANSESNNQNNKKNKLLHCLQDDILALEDGTKAPKKHIDDSITIVSCHSALREVQALHDYLLHQFNDAEDANDRLTPKDVLVMCPQIEKYAPYVNAVFTRGWQELNDEVPPLPCSIADRSAKDSDPLVCAFSELLTLPDSRFQVSQVLSFIRLPAIANKFCINNDDLEKITLWLEQASVHWGRNQQHKAQILGDSVNDSFTWQSGLSRLLQGFAYSDHDSIFQTQLLLSAVEGEDAITLGRLCLFIEQLQLFTLQLNTPRTAIQWQNYLLAQIDLLFARQGLFAADIDNVERNQQLTSQIDNSIAIIEQAIAALVEYCHHAHFEEKIDLAIVVDFLNHHFSQGDSSRQFMIGQVTFCSMLPMRSIPFKIIAILGLNDGDYPRQRQALGFDLMAQMPANLGDRSLRGDDRYLFLEALISARQALYLSYQGRNIKNNTQKQPSLVLKELLDYLAKAYGWQSEAQLSEIKANEAGQVKQIPMQAFSEANYSDNRILPPSFDANWLKIVENKHEITIANTSLILDDEIDISSITTMALVSFFQHPSRRFAQQRLSLYLDNEVVDLSDVEPFSVDHLSSYLLKQDLLTASLLPERDVSVDRINDVLQQAKSSGKFPDQPSTQAYFDTWLEDTTQFSDEIKSNDCDNPQYIDCQITLQATSNSKQQTPVQLSAKLPVKKTSNGYYLIYYRSSSAKAKDLFTLYLSQLFIQVWQQQNLATTGDADMPLTRVEGSRGYYFNAKSQQVEQYVTSDIENAPMKLNNLLQAFQHGQRQALLVNGELAQLVFKKSRGKLIEMTQARFEQFWYGTSNQLSDVIKPFGADPYIQYFWPKCPEISEILPHVTALYQGVYDDVTKVSKKAVSA